MKLIGKTFDPDSASQVEVDARLVMSKDSMIGVFIDCSRLFGNDRRYFLDYDVLLFQISILCNTERLYYDVIF